MMVNEELVIGKYLELKEKGETEGFLDEKHFGAIKLFINKKPDLFIYTGQIDEDIIFIGA